MSVPTAWASTDHLCIMWYVNTRTFEKNACLVFVTWDFSASKGGKYIPFPDSKSNIFININSSNMKIIPKYFSQNSPTQSLSCF